MNLLQAEKQVRNGERALARREQEREIEIASYIKDLEESFEKLSYRNGTESSCEWLLKETYQKLVNSAGRTVAKRIVDEIVSSEAGKNLF